MVAGDGMVFFLLVDRRQGVKQLIARWLLSSQKQPYCCNTIYKSSKKVSCQWHQGDWYLRVLWVEVARGGKFKLSKFGHAVYSPSAFSLCRVQCCTNVAPRSGNFSQIFGTEVRFTSATTSIIVSQCIIVEVVIAPDALLAFPLPSASSFMGTIRLQTVRFVHSISLHWRGSWHRGRSLFRFKPILSLRCIPHRSLPFRSSDFVRPAGQRGRIGARHGSLLSTS